MGLCKANGKPSAKDDFSWRSTAGVVEMAGELELEVGPEDVTELLPFHDTTWADEELLLRAEQRKWFLERESTSDEDAIKIVEVTRDLNYNKLNW